MVLCFSSYRTHLIERVNFQSKPIHAWHATDHVEIRQLGSKVGLKGHVVEVLIGYLWLTAVLGFQEKKRERVRKMGPLDWQAAVTGKRKVLFPCLGLGQERSRSPFLGLPLGTTTLFQGGHLVASDLNTRERRVQANNSQAMWSQKPLYT